MEMVSIRPICELLGKKYQHDLAMDCFEVEQCREEDNVNDSPGPDWSNKTDQDATQRDEKP